MKNIRLEFEAIGTQWVIDFVADPEKASILSSLISDHIVDFDKKYSRFRSDSWVRTTANHPGTHHTPADFFELWSLYERMYKITSGNVTPLIGDALERAGYDSVYSLEPKALKAIPKLEDAVEFKHDSLHVKYRVSLDFGAAGKGFLVDQIALLLKKNGISQYLIDAGGDMVNSPAPGKSTPVGLEDPVDPQQVIGIVDLQRKSLCGSAGNRRKWADYHHIINPHTLQSENSILAVWVLADSTLLADGISTCLYFVKPEILLKEYSFEYAILGNDRIIQKSVNFPVRLF